VSPELPVLTYLYQPEPEVANRIWKEGGRSLPVYFGTGNGQPEMEGWKVGEGGSPLSVLCTGSGEASQPGNTIEKATQIKRVIYVKG